jgi:5-methylcytosine-specific restriction protein A
MSRLSSSSPRLGTKPARLGVALKSEVERTRHRDNTQVWRSWYKTSRWQKLRLKVLRRDAVDISDQPRLMPMGVLFRREPWMWPRCSQTGAVLVGKHPAPNSPVVDHILPHRGDEALFWAESNLQTVSKTYHDKEKQSIEKRGRY